MQEALLKEVGTHTDTHVTRKREREREREGEGLVEKSQEKQKTT